MTRARSLSQLANSSVFTVATNNRVGIGSEVPTAKLDVDGTLNVSGNATIGGVATYEDVTNVDSVGIVTARSGVSVPDGQKIQLGAGNDLQIYHNGSDSYIQDAGTGDLIILANNLRVANTSGTNYITGISGGAVSLLFGGNAKLATTSTGVSITGTGTFSGNITAGSTVTNSGRALTLSSNDGRGGVPTLRVQNTGGGEAFNVLSSDGSATNVQINADGSATFKGAVTGDRTSATARSFSAFLNGTEKTRIQADGSIFIGGNSSSAPIHLSNSGSAVFSGTVQSTAGGFTFLAGSGTASSDNFVYLTPGQTYVNRTDNTSPALNLALSGSVNTSLRADGSAAFNGNVVVASSAGSGGTNANSQLGTYNSSNAYIAAYNTNATKVTNSPSFFVYDRTNSAYKARIWQDGSATFEGKFVSGSSSLANSIEFYNNSSSSNLPTVYARNHGNGRIFAGVNASATTTSFINADGSATFGQASNSTNNNGILLGANVGQLNLYTTRYNTDCFQILNTSGSGTNVAVRFDGNGTATFAGSVSATVGSFSGNVTSARTSSSHTCFNGTLNGTTTSNILADGSATLNGNVTSGAPDVSNGSAGGVQLFASGQLRIQRSSSGSASDKRFQMYYGTTETSSITANGAATFDSFAKAYRYEAGLGTSDGSTQLWTGRNSSSTATSKIFTDGSAEFAGGNFAIGSTGAIAIDRASSGNFIIEGKLSGSQTSLIRADGSAVFGGVLQGDQRVVINGAGGKTGSANTLLNYAGDGSTVTASFTADGAAEFAGTVQIGTPNYAATTTAGFNIAATGAYYSQQTASSNSTNTVHSHYHGNLEKYALKNNGSATFGHVGSGNYAALSSTSLAWYVSNSNKIYLNGSTGSATFASNIILGTSNTTAVTQIYSNGSTGGVHLSGGGGGSANIEVYSASHASLAKTMRFQTDSQERMRIDGTSGRVLIGKTTLQLSDDGTMLLGDGQTFYSVASSSSGVNTLHVYSTTASAYRFYVGMNGTVHATNTTISAISDQRLKENIRDLDAGLAEILSLQPRRFDWKAGEGKDIQNDQGFIAQEFEQVFPEMVDEWIDPAPEGEEPYKSVRADLIPVLVKALQETHAKIETLESEVAALKAS